jgi:hypothetical protein
MAVTGVNTYGSEAAPSVLGFRVPTVLRGVRIETLPVASAGCAKTTPIGLGLMNSVVSAGRGMPCKCNRTGGHEEPDTGDVIDQSPKPTSQ